MTHERMMGFMWGVIAGATLIVGIAFENPFFWLHTAIAIGANIWLGRRASRSVENIGTD